MPVLTDWDLKIDVDMVLRGQGADAVRIRAKSPGLVKVAEQALAQGLPLVRPAVTYRQLRVEGLQHEKLLLEGGAFLRGPLVAEHLAAAKKVVLALCTIGAKLEDWAAEVMAEDMILGLALDGVGSAAAEALATEACRRFEGWALSEGLLAGMPLNPGMVGWPVDEGQPQMFALLDGSEVGVSLTGGYMMVPRKSLSLALGLSMEPVRQTRTCDYCNMRASCRYQGAYPA